MSAEQALLILAAGAAAGLVIGPALAIAALMRDEPLIEF